VVEEERRWCDLIRELDALGRITTAAASPMKQKERERPRFPQRLGRRYRYFIVFDADSVMRGERSWTLSS